MATTGCEGEMERLITSEEVEFVRLELADTNGCHRGFLQDSQYFLSKYRKGFNAPQAILQETTTGNGIPNTSYASKIYDADGGLIPDLDTFYVLPWLDKTASVIVDFHSGCCDDETSRPSTSPRLICKQQLEKLSKLGYQLYSTFEYEFYLLDKDTKACLSNKAKSLSTHNEVQYTPLINEMMRNMKKIGLTPEHAQCKYGPAQIELTFSPTFNLSSPDNAFRYKQLVKEIALKNGCMATFMSKPFHDLTGSSGHFNHSLWDMNGKNVFYDGKKKNDGNKYHHLSEIAQHWLAGLMHHSDSLLCFAAPTPNCIERTNAGGLAPTTNAWGAKNRHTSYRVKDDDPENLYIENRVPGAASNPYLVTAAYIIAGMDGIKCKMASDMNYEGPLPKTLHAAARCLDENDVFVKELGAEFIKMFVNMKKYEHDIAEKQRADKRKDIYQWYMENYGEYI